MKVNTNIKFLWNALYVELNQKRYEIVFPEDTSYVCFQFSDVSCETRMNRIRTGCPRTDGIRGCRRTGQERNEPFTCRFVDGPTAGADDFA